MRVGEIRNGFFKPRIEQIPLTGTMERVPVDPLEKVVLVVPPSREGMVGLPCGLGRLEMEYFKPRIEQIPPTGTMERVPVAPLEKLNNRHKPDTDS